MKLIIALGNPGKEYTNTRHNVAWKIVEAFDLIWNTDAYARADLAHTTLGTQTVIFAKPLTFMNNSGEVVSYFKKQSDFNADSLIVLQDDVDIPIGELRISFDRGDAGHNGIKSIVDHFGSSAFIRIRIGVRPVDEAGQVFLAHNRADFVLARFTETEEEILRTFDKKIYQCIGDIISKGYKEAMNIYN